MRQDYPTAPILARAGYLCVTRRLTEHLYAIILPRDYSTPRRLFMGYLWVTSQITEH